VKEVKGGSGRAPSPDLFYGQLFAVRACEFAAEALLSCAETHRASGGKLVIAN
jgi:hypothetical protein